MITFNDIVNEAVGVNSDARLVEEAYADAEFFDIQWDPATEAAGSLGVQIGMRIRDAVRKIREWIRWAIDKIKELFAKVMHLSTGKINKVIYDALIAHLKELDSIDVTEFTSKKGAIKAIAEGQSNEVSKSQMEKFTSTIAEVNAKFKNTCDGKSIESYYANKIKNQIPENVQMITVNLSPLTAEKSRLAKEVSEVQEMSKILESSEKTYTDKYKTVETKAITVAGHEIKNPMDHGNPIQYTKHTTDDAAPTNVAPALVSGCNMVIRLVKRKISVIDTIVEHCSGVVNNEKAK